jgi:hypothetical protein
MKYFYGMLAALFGALIIALRIQGGKLHAAQIKLLLIAMDQVQVTKDKAVEAAKAKLNAALKSYYEANPREVKGPKGVDK